MKLHDLLRDTGLVADAIDTDREITAITCDSRRIEPGCLFVCIPGTRTDGHRYAADAERDGAAAIVVQRDLGLRTQLLTDNARRTWAQICANWFGRPSERLHLIGVTGTNGKTTTTTLVKSMLEHAGHKVGLIGTVCDMVGDRVLPAEHTTPDSYDLQSMLALMVVEQCDYCVMEVSSHALDQQRVAGCFYDIGAFTNLTQDHLDYHGTMENYLQAKKRLFSMCRTGVVNIDDPHAAQMMAGESCPFVTFAVDDDRADFVAHNVRHRADGVGFELVGTGHIGRVQMPIPGQFSVYNGLTAAAICLAAGMPFDDVVAALCRVHGVKGRAEVVPTGRDLTVVIDYAHTPDGLQNICRTLRECCGGRLVTLFGCGGDRDRGKRPQMGKIAADLSDLVVVTSDNPRSEEPGAIIADILDGMRDTKTPYTVIEDRVQAIHWAIAHAQPGDTLLLAGKGHETYQILRDGVIHLDEREVVADALRGTAENEKSGK